MKKKKLISWLAISLSVGLLLTACSDQSKEKNTQSQTTTSKAKKKKKQKKVDLNKIDLPQLTTAVSQDEDLVEMVTSAGSIKIKLFPKYAPKAVENFVTHAKENYYHNVPFHRVVKEFMIQSGDPKGDGTGGESIWKEEFAPEISKHLYHIRGALAMARTGGDVKEKTQGSQFYIVQNDEDVSDGLLTEDYPEKIIEAYKKGGTPDLDQQYSVFGQVIEGMDVVDKIANAPVETNDSGEQSKPKDPVKVLKINVLQEAKK